jgi:hypothetical protein
MTPDLFSVYYFSNATLGNVQERECHLVPLEQALKWFKHHTHNVPAQLGLTERVLMTDGGDCIVAEWKYGQGITWPKKESVT